MANANQNIPFDHHRPQHVSQFPKPPDYYLQYAAANDVKLGAAAAALVQPPPPPPPPPPAAGESYTTFGQTYVVDEECIVRSLEMQNIHRLYPTSSLNNNNTGAGGAASVVVDRKAELQKLLFSALANFMDLLDILVYCPRSARRQEKLEDINLIFINMQHLINELRPHQARETLRNLLEKQKNERLLVASTFTDEMDKVTDELSKCLQEFPALDEQSLTNISKYFKTTREILDKFKSQNTRLGTQLRQNAVDNDVKDTTQQSANADEHATEGVCIDLDADVDKLASLPIRQ